ncbi:CocE/NonD family hydrolase [Alteromonas pelagimontana]|uniref:CocE/NonD family hydrolase n=1 Tax=Alteromonas pelagimontana TaxID=1858656 RepID=A0A6M4M9K9_9ALTE|nr:CocE/NonD family hydrolase [Alteromonas pelagimontana]QJR79315.1 CocE/NonD family hydrolase [Alteromonas pelagimontana]QJR82673.1 CocE/NonD family hydrolase [Alteromonas pelagimontana]
MRRLQVKIAGQWLLAFAIITLSAFSAAAESQDKRAEYIRSHYAKYEYHIPMRDGKKLFTSVYIPYDSSKKYPMLMQRTPYRVAPYGTSDYKTRLGPSQKFEEKGYIFVFQDVRGKQMSEGEFVNMRPQDAYTRGKDAVDDATDTYDTIDWLVKNVPGNNGKVGMWGISYPGYYTSVSAINSHKALKAISPQAPIADWFFDDFHRNGAFSTPMAFLFFDSFDKPREGVFPFRAKGENELQTPDGYDFFKNLGPHSNVDKKYFKGERPFWNELTQHPNYDDYWQARNVLQHLNDIKPAVMIVGGWYDTEDLYGPLATYQKMSDGNKKKNVQIVMGPWYHGQWIRDKGTNLGEAQFGFETSIWFQDNVLLPFFEQHLRESANDSYNAKATVFETGANRWRTFAQWPPKNTHNETLYFQGEEKLGNSKPMVKEGFSDYVSDPNKPVPHSANISRGWDRPYMAEDQRFTARRPDVLVFNSPEMEEDMTIAGPVEASLWVSTDQSAADFVVKIIDVFPGVDENSNEMDAKTGNRHELVRWGIMRGRFRNSFSAPEPFTPNKPTLVKFELYDLLHNFKRGHKLQIQIQSSIFPFLDRNPQNYVDNIFNATPKDYVRAQHKVYHNTEFPSHIAFDVLSK